MSDLRNFQNKLNSIAADLGVIEHQIQYNWIYLDVLGVNYYGKGSEANGATGIAGIAVFIGILVLLAAGLVIYNILKVSILKKIKEYGILRAIGAESSQLYKIVIVQILLLCAIAIPIGAVVGVLSANTITAAATSMINPEVFLVALPSAVHAAKVSPKFAMAGAPQTIKRKISKSKKITSIERHLAWLNLKRNRSRTVTILSLFMSITLFVALNSFSSNLDISNAVKD